MALLIHVVIALSSVGITTYGYVRPSTKWLKLSYVFIALTLATGTILVLSNPVHMVQACVAGVLYVCIMIWGTISIRAKLAREHQNL